MEVEINYDLVFGRDEFKSFTRKIDTLQNSMIENSGCIKSNHDYVLNTLEPRLTQVFEPKFKKLEEQFVEMDAALEIKLNRDELEPELEKKCDIESINALREGLDELNAFVQSYTDKFADRQQNEREHKLLQKQLRALFDLISTMNEDEEDPMFTTKGLRCAACAKGV
jgi:hypothetical protein